VALCEYVTALSLGLFLMTFVAEFKHLNVQFVVDGWRKVMMKQSAYLFNCVFFLQICLGKRFLRLTIRRD
jgi:hypothetical protein